MKIRRAAVNAMLDHARNELPNECCGFLLGTQDTIEEATRATNLTPSPTRYQADPRDHFAVIRRTRREGLTVVGTYHSHPATHAVPSSSDLEHATYAKYLYVIVSLSKAPAADQIGAYRLAGQGFERVDLVVQETSESLAKTAGRAPDLNCGPSR